MDKENTTGSLVNEIEQHVEDRIREMESDYLIQRDLLTSGFKKEALEEANVYLEQELSELRNAVLQSESKAKWKIKKDLFIHRNELVDELFETVANDLKAFTSTEAYAQWAKRTLDLTLSVLDSDAEYQLTVRPQDKALFEAILQGHYPRVSLLTHEEIFIGGFILSNPRKHLQVDKTLDYQIRVQKEWFITHSGLDF